MNNTDRLIYPERGETRIDDSFWTPYLDKIRRTTLPYVLDKFEECGYLRNYTLVAEGASEGFDGPPFSDGLLCETIRGACDFLATAYDKTLDERIEYMASVIAAASDSSPDGYLCTSTMLRYPQWRWGENGGNIVIQHDLYDQGALVEAGISHYRATGRTTLLKCALRSAGCIIESIGMPPKRNIVPGHSLPEEAFVKLYRLLENDSYAREFAAEYGVKADDCLALAQFWYDARGNYEGRCPNDPFTHLYNQDHLPFAAQTTAEGHAVRATLCYTGAAAVVGETEREDMHAALERIWENVTRRKLHISGGIGTRHDIEGFDTDYNLPNNAYLETCAGVGLAFWSGAMNLLSPDSDYFDVFERTLYNNVLASVGEDGKHYFYQNPLVSDGSVSRWEWHGCPCCPPMLLKLFSTLDRYIYASDRNGIYVNMYIGSRYDGETLKFSQRDRRFTIEKCVGKAKFRFRVPEYSENFSVTRNGVPAELAVERGYAVVADCAAGDVIEIAFDEPVRTVYADNRVEADRGLAAVCRGAFVYCAEGDGLDFTLPETPEVGCGADTVTVTATDGSTHELIPYYRWNNHGAKPMRVWFNSERRTPVDFGGRLYRAVDARML